MDPGLEFRPASGNDIDILVGLMSKWRDLLRHSSLGDEQLKENLSVLLKDDNTEFLISISADGEPLGFVQQRYRYSLWLGRFEAYLEDIFVVENARGQRVGSRLMNLAVSQAKQRNCALIALYTNSDNVQSIAVYKKFGFESNTNRYPDSPNQYFVKALSNETQSEEK